MLNRRPRPAHLVSLPGVVQFDVDSCCSASLLQVPFHDCVVVLPFVSMTASGSTGPWSAMLLSFCVFPTVRCSRGCKCPLSRGLRCLCSVCFSCLLCACLVVCELPYSSVCFSSLLCACLVFCVLLSYSVCLSSLLYVCLVFCVVV